MKTSLILVLFLLSGCTSILPQWRVFQKKVPEPIIKPASQIEVERQTADYIARNIETPVQLKPMSVRLSESLGRPEKPIQDQLDEAEAYMNKSWQKELRKQQDQLDELNKLLTAQGGKKIEGTGINVFGFTIGGAGIALIVLCVMFPPIATILWTIFKRVSGALTTTAEGISNFIKDNPDSGAQLKSYLAETQDKVHKQVISKIKAKF